MEWWGNAPPSTMSWVYNGEPLYTLRYSTRLHRSGHIDLCTAVSKDEIMEHSQDGFVSKAMALCQVVQVYMQRWKWEQNEVVIMVYIYHHQFTFTSHSLSIGTNHFKLFNSSRTGYTRRNAQLRSHPVNYIVTCTFYAKPHQGHQSHHNLPLQVGSTCI